MPQGPPPGSELELKDSHGKVVSTLMMNNSGVFTFVNLAGDSYTLRVRPPRSERTFRFSHLTPGHWVQVNTIDAPPAKSQVMEPGR